MACFFRFKDGELHSSLSSPSLSVPPSSAAGTYVLPHSLTSSVSCYKLWTRQQNKMILLEKKSKTKYCRQHSVNSKNVNRQILKPCTKRNRFVKSDSTSKAKLWLTGFNELSRGIWLLICWVSSDDPGWDGSKAGTADVVTSEVGLLLSSFGGNEVAWS
jgi:hypothetical protein